MGIVKKVDVGFRPPYKTSKTLYFSEPLYITKTIGTKNEINKGPGDCI